MIWKYVYNVAWILGDASEDADFDRSSTDDHKCMQNEINF